MVNAAGRTTGKRDRRIVVLCLAIAVLAGATSAAGLLFRGDGSLESVTSVRGERYEMTVTGVYAWNSLRMVAEGTGWDMFTLLFAVPALLAALPGLFRGSLRAQLFTLGILAYLFYQYLMYAVAWAFGPLFLPFVLIQALSLTGIVALLSGIPVAGLPERFTDSFPRRSMAALSFALAALLILMWLRLVASAYRDGVQGLLHGQTTFVVQALDLGLIVPLAVFTGVTALRGRAVGYLLCSTVVVKAFAMGAAICAMLLSAWVHEGTLETVPFAVFATAAGISGWLGIRMYGSERPAPGPTNAG